MLTNIYECLAITLRSWRSLCDHCELMANGIRKPILHTFATGETSITFETPQKRPRMLTNRYECLAIICDHYEFMANCIRKPIRHIFATVWEKHKRSDFVECQAMAMDQLVALAQRRVAWNALAKQLRWGGLPPYHWTPWSVMELIHTFGNKGISRKVLFYEWCVSSWRQDHVNASTRDHNRNARTYWCQDTHTTNLNTASSLVSMNNCAEYNV